VKVNFFEASLTFLAKHAKEPNRKFWQIFKKLFVFPKFGDLKAKKIQIFLPIG
jgi:hypothetical protein